MKVFISKFAKQAIYKTAKYILTEFGRKSKDKFMSEVRHTRKLIENNPYIGKLEPFLIDLPCEYRSFVVSRHNKIVYCIKDDCVSVVDFWDCRRDPDTLAAQVK
ncbi:MAG: hypothetical protein IKO99_03035 [Bacteroidales bacterium]|jgi:plasmid stabilization system protein ParE|nr:hypothetical protein [Bacteroidales bacterium]